MKDLLWREVVITQKDTISSMKDFNDRQFLQWKTSKKDYFLNERLDSNGGLRKTWWLDERLAWRGLQKLRKTSFFFLQRKTQMSRKDSFLKDLYFFFSTWRFCCPIVGGWKLVSITFGNKLLMMGMGQLQKFHLLMKDILAVERQFE